MEPHILLVYEQHLFFSTCSLRRVPRGEIAIARPGRPPKVGLSTLVFALRWWGHVTDRPSGPEMVLERRPR